MVPYVSEKNCMFVLKQPHIKLKGVLTCVTLIVGIAVAVFSTQIVGKIMKIRSLLTNHDDFVLHEFFAEVSLCNTVACSKENLVK